MGLHVAFGVDYETVAYCERESFPASILQARMDDGVLHHAPIHSDMETFPCEDYQDIDIISAGIPCQPYSIAGARRGEEDERALWPVFADIAKRTNAKSILIENVPDFLNHAEGVYDELRRLGYNWYPPCFTNAAFWGAPHGRKRVFLLAEHKDNLGYLQENLNQRDINSVRDTTYSHSNGDRTVKKQDGARIRSHRRGPGKVWIANPSTKTIKSELDSGSYWDGESPVCGVDDGSPDRLDRLKALGNGVVPIMAAGAVSRLVRHGFIETEVFEQNRLEF
jgi:DNA (cytosine-5)-methyltransferase 1